MVPSQNETDYIDSNGYVLMVAGHEESVRIHKQSAPPRDPVFYPAPVGIITLGNSGNLTLLLTQFKEALKP